MEILDKIIDGVFKIVAILCLTEVFAVFVKAMCGKYKPEPDFKQYRFILHQSDGDPLGIEINLKKENKNEMDEKSTD